MDKIPLRTYLKEIENLIDRGDNDQAIAHCRHILKTYPKNLATYRLLGKAYLESRRFGDAADVFQRVLSSVPDDFVSHVGMSIIREDEGNQDASIWHMERAFETQPYNSAIQDELRRLYGTRDGLEPPKVRLTRGALARMYARGNLYQQAIGELRAALAEDPQRSDLQVMLARMYFLAGQRVEAVETCSTLLKKLPYCLEANRVISAILPDTERKEETQVYRERVMALDPYLVLASPYETSSENVRDQVVVIEKVDYKEAQIEEGSQPSWASSIGVSFEEFGAGGEPIPDWLQAVSQEGALSRVPESDHIQPDQPPAEETPPPAFVAQEGTELVGEEESEELPSWISFPDTTSGAGSENATSEIPEWMKEAGWEPSTGSSESTLPPFEYPEGGEEDISGIAKAELPPWLQALAPKRVEPPAISSEGDESLETIPWLEESEAESVETESGLPSGETEQPLEFLQEAPGLLGELDESGQEEELPEWAMQSGAAPVEPVLSEGEHVGEFESAAEEAMEETPIEAEELPDWLLELDATRAVSSLSEGEPTAEMEPALEESLDEEVPAEAEELPDWLLELDASQEESATREGEPTEEMEPALEESLEGEAPAEAEELPDWLLELDSTQEESTISEGEPTIEMKTAVEEPLEEEAPIVAEELPDWLPELDATQEESTISEGEPTAEMKTAVEEPLEEEAPVVAEELPDWLLELDATRAVSDQSEGEPAAEMEPVKEESLDEDAPAEAGELPDWLHELEATREESTISEGEPTAEIEPAVEEPLEGEAQAEVEELPDWFLVLEAISTEPVQNEGEPVVGGEIDGEEFTGEDLLPEEGEPIEAEGSAGEVPPWIQELGVTTPETSQLDEDIEAEDLTTLFEKAPQSFEIPDWLKSFEETPLHEPDVAGIEPGDATETFEVAAHAEDTPDWIKELSSLELPDEEAQAELSASSETPIDGEVEGAEDLDWLQIIGEKPMGEGTAFILEDGSLADSRMDDYSLADLEALLADTQPIRLGDERDAVPFNEILEEIDAGLQAEIPELEGVSPVMEEIEPALVDEAELIETVSAEFEEPPLDETVELPVEEEAEPTQAEEDELTETFTGELEETPPDEVAELPVEEEAEPALAGEAELLEAFTAEFEETPLDETDELDIVEKAEPALAGEAELLEAFTADIEEIPFDETAELGGEDEAEPSPIKEPGVGVEVPIDFESAPLDETAPVAEIELQRAGEIPDQLDEETTSLGWLESLAAKHGVSEDELFPPPPAALSKAVSLAETELPESLGIEGQGEGEPVELVEAGLPEQVGLEESADNDWLGESPISLPEWMQETITLDEALASEKLPQDIPDWLKALQAEDEQASLPGEAEQEPVEIEPPAEPGEAEAGQVEEVEIPDWLRAVQEEADQELAQDQMEAEPEMPAAQQDTDAALAWLESLAARQGAPEEELFTEPEQRSEIPPADLMVSPEGEPKLPGAEALLEAPPADLGLSGETDQIPSVEEEKATAEWFDIQPTGTDRQPDHLPEEQEAPAEPFSQEEPELPDWLVEGGVEEFQEEEWTPPVEPVKAALRAPRFGTAPLSHPPAKPVNINKASLIELEVLPGVGFVLAQNIITYREAFGLYSTVDDLIKVPGITPGILAEIRPSLMVPAPEITPAPQEAVIEPEVQSEVIIARNRLAEGDVEGTVAQYSKLIKNKELLPEIIRDLKEALHRFPVDVSLWQTLGDAHMRNDELADALEAYTKAEELLR